jgi:hypothetical protein
VTDKKEREEKEKKGEKMQFILTKKEIEKSTRREKWRENELRSEDCSNAVYSDILYSVKYLASTAVIITL